MIFTLPWQLWVLWTGLWFSAVWLCSPVMTLAVYRCFLFTDWFLLRFVLFCLTGSHRTCCLGGCDGRFGSSGRWPFYQHDGPFSLGADSYILWIQLSFHCMLSLASSFGVLFPHDCMADFLGLVLVSWMSVVSLPVFLALLCSIDIPWIVPKILIANFQCLPVLFLLPFECYSGGGGSNPRWHLTPCGVPFLF